jgi:hypothetical protein
VSTRRLPCRVAADLTRIGRSRLRSNDHRASCGGQASLRAIRCLLLGGRSTVGHGALDAVIGVRIPASQPHNLTCVFKHLRHRVISLSNSRPPQFLCPTFQYSRVERIGRGDLIAGKLEVNITFNYWESSGSLSLAEFDARPN